MRPVDNVPTVPAQKTPEINAESAETERNHGHAPGGGTGEAVCEPVLDDLQRLKAKPECNEGEGEQQQEVEPLRHPSMAVGIEVDEVGEYVRRIWEEQQPHGEQRHRMNEAAGAFQAEAEAQRDGSQEEIPQQKDVAVVSGDVEADVQHDAAPEGGEEIEQ